MSGRTIGLLVLAVAILVGAWYFFLREEPAAPAPAPAAVEESATDAADAVEEAAEDAAEAVEETTSGN